MCVDPDKETFFGEIEAILNQNGQILMVEPPFHVSEAAFEETVQKAKGIGFASINVTKILFSKTVILTKC